LFSRLQDIQNRINLFLNGIFPKIEAEELWVSTRDDLLRSDKDSNFLETVYACSSNDHADRSAVVSELVALHNEGLIDVVGSFQSLKNDTSNGPDFS